MLNKTGYIILSLFLLITTAGLTINLHYCAGNIYSVAVDAHPDNCCKNDEHMANTMNMNHQAMCHTNGNDADNCDNETIIVKINDTFTDTVQKIDISNNFVITFFRTLLYDEINGFASNDELTDLLSNNNSLPDTRHILSLFQSFLL